MFVFNKTQYQFVLSHMYAILFNVVESFDDCLTVRPYERGGNENNEYVISKPQGIIDGCFQFQGVCMVTVNVCTVLAK